MKYTLDGSDESGRRSQLTGIWILDNRWERVVPAISTLKVWPVGERWIDDGHHEIEGGVGESARRARIPLF